MEQIIFYIILVIAIGVAIRIGLNKLEQKVAQVKQQNFATQRGKEGEKEVNNVLNSLGKDYVSLSGIILKTKKGSTELDHIVVSPYGIFVIETKNYSGKVVGDDDYKDWLHYDKAGKERKFYSPIKQNAGHIGTLRRTINKPESVFIPIVVFAGKAELKIKSKTTVIKLDSLASTIKSHKTKTFTKEEVKEIVKEIKSNNMDSIMGRKEHIKYVKSIQNKD